MECLTVLIVNWNRRVDLLRLLEDLSAQTEPADEIIVVDNGSTDGSSNEVEQKFPAVCLTRLHKNMGLSLGRNVGIAAAKSEAITVLDNDLRILDRTFLAKVRQSLDSHPDCGVISFACLQGLWIQPPAKFPDRVYTLNELYAMASTGQAPVMPRSFYDWFFWGGACVMRRQVFKTVGLFDDVFNYGGEEWDMAYRCHAAGIRLLSDEGLWVVHVRSPEMRSPVMPSLILKNMVIAQSRYLPRTDLLIFLLMQFAKSTIDYMVRGNLGALLSLIGQIISSWRLQVSAYRRPVTRETMRKFYYLRTHQPEDYPPVTQSRMSTFDFYRSRNREPSSLTARVWVKMTEN